MREVESKVFRAGLPTEAVLYVEDETDNFEMTEIRLRRRYLLVRASSDREACQRIKESSTHFFAILMDIQLKGSTLDGIQLTRLFRGKLDPKIDLPPYAQGCPLVKTPILFVTAYGARYFEDELREAGGDALITKPVDFVKLMVTLATVHSQKMLRALQS